MQRNSHLVQQNSYLVQAYGALSGQHGIVLHELAALASQYCLLEKELFDAQTDAVAYEAVVITGVQTGAGQPEYSGSSGDELGHEAAYGESSRARKREVGHAESIGRRQ